MFVEVEESIQKILSGNMNKKPNQFDWVFFIHIHIVSVTILLLLEFIRHTTHAIHI